MFETLYQTDCVGVKMSKMELDLGVVSVKSNEDTSFRVGEMKITYDTSKDFPYFHKIDFIDGNAGRQCMSKKFHIINKEDRSTILNDDIILVLSVDQKAKLFDLTGRWEYQPLNLPSIPLAERKAGDFAKDFGIVFFYSQERQQFVLANFKIDFDWSCTQPIISFITVYDDERFPIEVVNSQCKDFIFSYRGIINEMMHYEVCGQNFLLSKKQIDLLNYIRDLLTKKY